MIEEVELKRLLMRDKSELILTNLRVYQKKRGFFGEKRTIIPREAITTVQIESKRIPYLVGWSVSLLISIFFLIWVTVFFPSGPFPILPVIWLIYSISMIIRGLYKRRDIHIRAGAETIGGVPKNADDARMFCDLLLSEKGGKGLTVNKAGI